MALYLIQSIQIIAPGKIGKTKPPRKMTNTRLTAITTRTAAVFLTVSFVTVASKERQGMNNDLISREALKKAITEHCRSEAECLNHFWYDENIVALIDNAPTVAKDYDTGYQDGLEDGLNDIRPQGEWKLLYKGDESHCANYECSICQREIYFDTKTESLTDYPFCHCGADMRKGGAE